MKIIKNLFTTVTDYIDKQCEGLPAWKVVTGSVISTLAFLWVKEFLDENENLLAVTKKRVLKYIRKVPHVQRKIDFELQKIEKDMLKDMNDSTQNDPYILELPQNGLTKEEILEKACKYGKYGNYKWEEGYTSGTVYNGNKALTDLMTEVYGLSIWTNPLHTDVFPGIRKMEAEVVRMCCSMFHGGKDSCGTMTSGGTESIIMACKAYRNYAMEVRGIKRPEILAPISAHAAFVKGAQLLNIRIKHAPLDPKTMKVNLRALEKMINKNTCMIVGSAPEFAHGVIDPIEDLASLAVKYQIPLHVDACLGGFLVAFAHEAGFRLPSFDFRVKGVTSISCDTHKYGFAPKGSSVVLYSELKYRSHQFFVQPDWPGGIYATPAISGSRPGGIIAATWAALIYYGRSGYIDCTKKIIQTARKIAEGVSKIPGIRVIGQPEVSVIAFASDDFNIYTLSDDMTKKGWNLNALQFPSCIHIAVTVPHTTEGVAERFIADLTAIAESLLKNPCKELSKGAAIYGMAQSLADRTIVEDVACCYLDCTYATEVPAPITNGK